MKKTNKPNPLKFFNDNKAMAYKKAGGQMSQYKKALRKADNGEETGSSNNGPGPNQGPPPNMGTPLSLSAALGNFNVGYDANVSKTGLSGSRFNAGYNNNKLGLGVNATYDPTLKNFSGGIDYNTTIGKKKTPLKLGVSYNRKKGGAVNSKKK